MGHELTNRDFLANGCIEQQTDALKTHVHKNKIDGTTIRTLAIKEDAWVTCKLPDPLL
jgi:hypothetical protein